jgi:hypothetical protein
LTDEVAEVQTQAVRLWEEAGKLYMQENENDLKDQMDFLMDEPVHYPPHGMSCTMVFKSFFLDVAYFERVFTAK